MYSTVLDLTKKEQENFDMNHHKTTLITGGARRIGRTIAMKLHARGHNIMIHYRSSSNEAETLKSELNRIRKNSCDIICADLSDNKSFQHIERETLKTFAAIDTLINNASAFYPTPLADINEPQWDDLMVSNLKAPLFLAKQLTPSLQKQQGCIINILDIYAERPLADHPIYCATKAGLQMLTKSLARDLAPNIRVNGVAPGAILWPENKNIETDYQDQVLKRIPLNRLGSPKDIAKTVEFLIEEAPYITGQIIAVDGGRSVMP